MSNQSTALRHTMTSHENGVKAKDLIIDAGFHLAVEIQYCDIVDEVVELLKKLDVAITKIALDEENQKSKGAN